MTPEDFRDHFPALRTWTWLDTPGAPPGATPVIDALRDALTEWHSGCYQWTQWDDHVQDACRDFAKFTSVPLSSVAGQSSLADAATAAARCAPAAATIVVAEDEFRSVLFPALLHCERENVSVQVVAREPGVSRTQSLLAAISESTGLVMVSEVLTNDGELVDIDALCRAAHRHGALVFANLTQSLGVLRTNLSEHPADIIAAHGYKWLLSPRGAAWMIADSSNEQLRPVVASWKTSSSPHQFFGGPYTESPTATRCNSSPAWLSWIGARAALGLLARIPEAHCRQHTTHLADIFTTAVREMDFTPINDGAASHIAVTAPPRGFRLDPRHLLDNGLRATLTKDGALRVGFHYFNNVDDVQSAARAARGSLVVQS